MDILYVNTKKRVAKLNNVNFTAEHSYNAYSKKDEDRLAYVSLDSLKVLNLSPEAKKELLDHIEILLKQSEEI